MLIQALGKCFDVLARLPFLLWRKWFLLRLRTQPNIEVQGKLTIYGHPLIDMRPGTRLTLGAGVTLNSENRGYHINMHSPVKLFADREGAEIVIGAETRVHGSCLHAFQSIRIGRKCLIAANCQIFDGNGHDLSFPDVDNRINTAGSCRPVLIEDCVWIGADTLILPGVTIGRGSVISANSVVTKSIPAMVLAGGNPAVVLKTF